MIKLHALGESVIDVDSTRVTPSAERSFALLLYLSLHRGRRIPRPILHEMVFPSYDEEQASHCLRQLLYHQRSTGAPIDTNSGGVLLPAESVWFDFDELLESAEPPDDLLRAADGGIFPGYLPSHSESFAEWFEGHREQMTLQLSRNLAEAAKRARSIGNRPSCERIARVVLRLDPFNREATQALAQMLALSGARSEAVRLLDRYRQEVGGPVPELQVAGDPANLFGERLQPDRQEPLGFEFSGRVDEMLRLNDALNAARSKECQRVLIFGEPGIGKTRTVREFCTVATLSGAVASVVTLQPSDQHRPFGAFADLLPSLLGMPGALACPSESLSLLRRGLAASHSPILSTSGGDGPDTDLAERLVVAIAELIDALSNDRALVLAFEDVQWIDEGSARVLASLARAGSTRRLLALFSSRKEDALEWLGGENTPVLLIGLPPLPSGVVAQMLETVETRLALDLDGQFRLWLEETAQGNPLFLESLLTHYLRTRERFAVPPTLLALLDRRIDLLSANATTALQICALLGKHSSLETIARSTGLPQFALLQAASDLETRGLVRVEGTWIHPSHALIADRALRRMGPIQTQMSHRCVANALDTLAEKTPSLLWACAEHWTLAGDQERARSSLNSCVGYATSIGRPRDAAKILKEAMGVELFSDDRIAIARQMIRAADLAGEPELVLEGWKVMKSAGELVAHDDIEFAAIRAEAQLFSGSPAEGLRLFVCATATSATPDHRVAAAIWILKYADMHGDANLARTAIDAVGADVALRACPKVRSEFELVSNCVLNNWDKAADAARGILETVADEPASVRASPRLNAAMVLWRSGAPRDALVAAEAAHADAQTSGSYRLGITIAALLADLSFELDNCAAANEWIDRALASVERFPELNTHLSLWIIQIVGAIYLGDLTKAIAMYDDAHSRGLFDGSELRERWRSVLAARLAQKKGAFTLPKAELLRLEAAIDGPHPMSGTLDFEIATACEHLMSMGRWSEAQKLCHRFTSSPRRNRAVLSREIRRVAALIDTALDRSSSEVSGNA